ncbi:MAG: hypothetical protein EBU46_02400 [Nitrosomonadaceae bacterium]|nr:hypothetical protein [Nitrosomonadaceae bacterium]
MSFIIQSIVIFVIQEKNCPANARYLEIIAPANKRFTKPGIKENRNRVVAAHTVTNPLLAAYNERPNDKQSI